MKKPSSKTRYPLESFDPRFRNIWLRGILGEVKVIFDTEREAQAFQARLQLYRARLKEIGDPDAVQLYRAKTSLQGCTVLIRPTDTVFKDVLDAFNQPVKGIPPVSTGPLSDLDLSTKTELSIDDIFSDLPTEGELP